MKDKITKTQNEMNQEMTIYDLIEIIRMVPALASLALELS
jgi:hypothetical protein